jgi:cellulose synthase/poly-beta-1,6-N-acetylglucosamine synthase-like glycosyltransferase
VLWLGLFAVPPVADTLVRAAMASLAHRFKTATGRPGGELRWLVLIPSHSEGEAVGPTLRSVIAATRAASVRTVVVLDGPDPHSQTVCDLLGVETLTKKPAGPTKGDVLGWVAKHLSSELAEVDAVMLLDVGSSVVPDFFASIMWPEGVAGVQAILAGNGEGAGAAAAYSEHSSQQWDDRGRETLGWAVRLRGTGTALTPEAFFQIAQRLRTRVEDHEATLLLASAGKRIVLGPPEAVVRDEKPAGVRAAARQRARWLAGRYAILLRQPGALFRLIRRRPMEGIAFLIEIMSRPFSLTAILRVAIAGVLMAAAWQTGNLDAAVVAAVVRLALAWIGALPLLPHAIFHWLGARQWRGQAPEPPAPAAPSSVSGHPPAATPKVDGPTPDE